MKKINKMIIGMANFALLGLVLMPNAMADTIKCSDLTNEELKYIAEQSDPEILDLTCSNGTPFTDEYLDSSNNMQEYISSIGEYFEDRVTPYSTQVLQVPEYIQEKNNWCANIKQVLQYYNGNSRTQAEYADETETDKYGSAYVFRVTNTLNKYAPSGVQYVHTIGSTWGENNFFYLMSASVMNRKPAILHALTKSLTIYNGKNLGHYLTVSGYIDEWQSQSIAYVDTFSYDYGKGNVAGFHIDSKANVYKTVSNGSRYIIHDKYTAEL